MNTMTCILTVAGEFNKMFLYVVGTALMLSNVHVLHWGEEEYVRIMFSPRESNQFLDRYMVTVSYLA